MAIGTEAFWLADPNDKPAVIDKPSYYTQVVDPETHTVIGDKPWFIEFYTPWCYYCKLMAPAWDELHLKHKDSVNVARVDCDSKDGKPLCHDLRIPSYPTILYFPTQSTDHMTYMGERTFDAFEHWLKRHHAI